MTNQEWERWRMLKEWEDVPTQTVERAVYGHYAHFQLSQCEREVLIKHLQARTSGGIWRGAGAYFNWCVSGTPD